MVRRIEGKSTAAAVIDKVKAEAARLERDHGVKPGLAVVIVGEDPASQTYVASKSRTAKECGFHSVQHSLPEGTSQEELAALVDKLNADPAIHGVLVQLPLPKGLESEPIIQAILSQPRTARESAAHGVPFRPLPQ